ncbi:hypothetical protein C8R43DRAFT_1067973 [Mycena crocata]|nr:hypothetical protein C8R43DRAFT_1067973 [Mycena crocata]
MPRSFSSFFPFPCEAGFRSSTVFFSSAFFALFHVSLSPTLYSTMVKLGLSASVIAFFTFFPFTVSASSFTRRSLVQARAGLNVTGATNSSSTQRCAFECAQPEAIAEASCAGVSGLSRVPCACTDAYSVAQEACSRCRLPFAGTQNQLKMNTFNEEKNFGDFARACETAGRPIRPIDLEGVSLFIANPINFTFAIPDSVFDETFPDYITAVCMRPDLIRISQCIIGGQNWVRCPNSDISGILIRFSAYLVNLLLGIVLMYSPAEASTAVWTQLLTVYSLLISSIIAIGNGEMSRFHSGMAVFLVMSPLSSTLVVYAILGFCGRSHRLDSILSGRREHLLPRLLVVVFGIISLALVIFSSAADVDHFASNPCESDDSYKTLAGILMNLLFIPYAGVLLIMINLANTGGVDASIVGIIFLTILPFIILVISFVYAVIKQRHVLAKQYQVQNNRWKIWVMWDVLAVQYPLLHFYGVFFIPMLYWILVNELRTIGTPDNIFSSSFGQILALFVVLPPLLQVVLMAPTARGWFMNLTFVRVLTGRSQFTPTIKPFTLEDGIPEKNSSADPFKDPAPDSYQVHNMPVPGPSYAHSQRL